MKSTSYSQIIKTFNNGISFAHVAYELEKAFKIRNTGIQFNQYWDFESLKSNISKVEILTISGLWDNKLLDEAKNLKFIQSIGAGYDQFDLKALKSRGIKLANASGCNKNAVSEHAISMMLALTRLIHHGRDNQKKHFWRPMISDSTTREDELENKTMLLIGLGQIGSRISRIAKAFGMKVIAIRQNPKLGKDTADEIHPISDLNNLVQKADFLVLACPLTEETRSIVDSRLLSKMKKTSYLINVARGGIINENDLSKALTEYVRSFGYKWFDGWNGYSAIKFLKYAETHQMAEHCDHISSLFDGNVKGIPMLSIVGQLNKDFEGGEFVMWGDQTIPFETGDVIIFPSNFMYPHRVEPVTKGERYSYVSWAY